MKFRIALAGNPNVGKSTIFNSLTGLRQHTGNWPGKTVACASGSFSVRDAEFSIVDLPGIYSFDVRSEEEGITRDCISSMNFDFLLLVCDATCLERGLHLLNQAADLMKKRQSAVSAGSFSHSRAGVSVPQVILCVNLCDEAEKKGILVDFSVLEQTLGIPVVSCRAREKQGLSGLKQTLFRLACARSFSEGDSPFSACMLPGTRGLLPDSFSPETLALSAVVCTKKDYRKRGEQIDRFLTGPVTGSAVMCLLLTLVFWITIAGANVPSALLYDLFSRTETALAGVFGAAGLPAWLTGCLIHGVFRVVSWIVSVMLPPMAIFFPLFTILEDLGYLPRIAFNMDGAFQKCRACGKQCLTMAMGLGCNAAGVVGCRIIDSPRERLIAVLTNSLVPCNGRFPLLLTMISLFLAGSSSGESFLSGAVTALILTGLILLGVGATLAASWLLSHTVLKGMPSSFTLELPPYRRPQAGKVIIRSIMDRTLFVLGRAVLVAAPAGLLIWLMANVPAGNGTLLSLCSGFLDPLGRLMGLDGIILMAFLLGFPANEIVLPIILMAYLQNGTLVDMEDQNALYALLISHGWTMKTAVCMAVFTLFHWPCSTTCLTIKKETGSLRWTAAAILLPACTGMVLCILISGIWGLVSG